MRARSLLTVLVGLPLACAALVLLDQRLDQRPGEREAIVAGSHVAVATVVVAARDLAPGDLLRADALKEMAWPADSVPLGAFASIEQLLGAGGSRRARHAILAGEPVLATKVYGFRDRGTPGRHEVAPAGPRKLAQTRPPINLRGVTP